MPYAADEIADVLRNSVVFVDLNNTNLFCKCKNT